MLAWSALLVFLVALAAAICVVILLQPDEYFRTKHKLECPETGRPVNVELSSGVALKSLVTGVERMELKSCTRWPERQGCDQACLLQLDLKPDVLSRVLGKFYDENACGLCGRLLGETDWRRGRLAMLDRNGRLVPGGQLPLHEFPRALRDFRPLCWPCHVRARQEAQTPVYLFKGDRRNRKEEPLLQD